MKLKKAIETLQSWLDEQKIFPNSDLANSLKLLIEAGKRLQVIRGYPHYQWKQLLPGETEE